MAISYDLQQSTFGVPFVGAYYRIATASINYVFNQTEKHKVMLDIVGYATSPLDETTNSIDFRRYHAPLSEVEVQVGDTFLAKCYSWAMQHPDLSGSTAI